MKALIVPLQLILLALALFLAHITARAFPFLPGLVVKALSVPLNKVVLTTFFSFHVFLYLISLYFNREFLFSNLRRMLIEMHFVYFGTILSACYLFLFTDVFFDPNFVAYAYIFNFVLYFVTFLIAAYTRRSQKNSNVKWLRDIPFITSIKDFLFCRWAALMGLTVVILGFVVSSYKTNEDFKSLVNHLRVSFIVGSASNWELKDVHPGQSFEQPIDIKFSRRDIIELYILERAGRLYRISVKPPWRKDLLLDISANVGAIRVENGALSFALHPEFDIGKSANSGFVYVYYTHTRPEMQRNRLSRFDLSLADLRQRVMSEVILIDQGRNTRGLHNGGSVLFGPDGFLYLSIGNFAVTTNSQTIDGNLSGGIIRIDIDQRGGNVSGPIKKQPLEGRTAGYYIPTDNPFYGVQGVLEEYWALGFRNPFRMSMDGRTGEIWLGDVGHELYEEVNKIAKGSNGQAPYREGPVLTGKAKPEKLWGTELVPVYYYRQTALERVVIGGIVYRGDKYPELYGHYIFADNQAGLVRSYDPEKPELKPRLLARTDQLGQNGITSLNETPAGDIYLTVLGSKSGRLGGVLQLERTNSRRSPPDKLQISRKVSYVEVSAKYDMLCSRCHGMDGKGDSSTPLEGKPTNFTVTEWQKRVSDQQIKSVITKGGAELGLSRDMPSWQGVFSEAELDLMVRKIRSFGKSESVEQ